MASLNLHGMKAGWRERAPLVLAALAAEAPDVVLLQETARWFPQPRWLAWRLSRATGYGYRALTVPKRGWWWFIEGLAVLTRLPVLSHARLDLRGNERVAQRVTLAARSGREFDAYNVHLAHRGDDERLRTAQAGRLLGWMATRGPVPAIVGGDFNADPWSETLGVMQERLASAHGIANGAEPAFTAPSHAGPGEGRTIDYLFLNGGFAVERCSVAFGGVDRGGRRVYPSDHLGLVARLAFAGRE